ncbi:MAG TPA: sigma-70 family RNA polymerase sigma factor [Gemmataceae bacterium]|jgi:RNA polymerase sigma factor (sigma-70 family)
MAGTSLHAVIEHIRRLHSVADAAQRSDRELLRSFVTNNDQDAFAVVVTRHAPLVWGVCRRILGHRQDAEDAFQATFLILARRAGSTRWQASVGGWLYTVAHRLAVRARKQAERRRACEREVSRTPRTESSLCELATVVDEELRRLPAKYRDPLLLHYLEGATAEAAARQLSLSRGTFYNRLNRGRELLRERLSRQGLSLAAPLLAAALTHEAEAAAPSLIQAALRGTTGSVPERVAILAAEALRNTLLTKLKIGAALGLLLGAAAGGVAMLTPQAPPSPAPQAERPADPPKVDDKAARRVDRDGDPLPEGAVARLGTRRFRIGTEHVNELAFAPDGKTIAVASLVGLWLLDVATGKLTKSFRPSYTSFWRVTFSPDSKRLLAAAQTLRHGPGKTMVQIWDVAGGRKTAEVELEHIYCLGWTAEGQPLAVCPHKQEITLHELETGRKRLFVEKKLSDTITAPCAVGKNVLAAGDATGAAHIWDTISGKERWVFKTAGELAFYNSLVLSPDGRWLASRSRDAAGKHIVQLWNLTTGKATHTIAADQQSSQAVIFTPDGKTLATIRDSEVRFWDTASGRERGRLKGGGSFSYHASFAPDSKTLAMTDTMCGAIHLWDVATGERKPEPEGHSTNWVQTVSFSSDGKRVATSGGLDGTIRVWDAASGRQLTLLRRSPSSVLGCAFSTDGRTLVSCWDDRVLLSDAATGRELHVLEANDWRRLNQRPNMSMHVSSDGRKAIVLRNANGSATGGAGAAAGGPFTNHWLMACWDTTARKQLFRRQLTYHGGHRGIVASPEATVFALPGTKREPMYLEDVETGERLLTFPILKGSNSPLAFSPDGRLLLSHTSTPAPSAPGGSERTLHLWEVLTASELLTLPISIYLTAKAVISPDGRLLAAIAPEEDTIPPQQEILLWDLKRGKELHRFKGYGSSVTSLAFSSDGRRLVSGLYDTTLLVWDVAAVRSKDQPAALNAESVRRAWDDLGTDARKAFAARWTLAATPEQAVSLLRERLNPAQPADPQRLRRLLADLDSEQFAVREKARRELTELGELAEPALRRTLANKPSLEVRRQIQTLLDNLHAPVTRPETLRALRAVAVLEDIASPEARRVLEQLARGTAEARLTREAKSSLRRLEPRSMSSR